MSEEEKKVYLILMGWTCTLVNPGSWLCDVFCMIPGEEVWFQHDLQFLGGFYPLDVAYKKVIEQTYEYM